MPIVLGTLLALLGRFMAPGAARWFALLAAILSFAVTLPIYTGFDNSSAAMQFAPSP